MTYFGTNLKKIRQIKGLSQQAFAELIDLNRGVISSYEEGRAEPKIETLLRIATYFGIPTDDIISKPLTVNQLANFTLIEDSIATLEDVKECNLKELTNNGENKNIELQKIFAQFDFVYFVDENLANNSVFEKEATLFLKEIKKDLKKYKNYLTLTNGVAMVSNTFLSDVENYAIVGVLGSDFYEEQQSMLKRIELLEKMVYGN
ncbi:MULTISPECIES: helix-turn-helix domain-containing protein [Flavobacterium]|uniref:Helix-turn-helix domain-containing protein n=1 Tax=Flavobacterium jumunjinense TaxID=998845 RepID=A0ABV5GRD3_9FLAO|nr:MULTISPECIES: helix-turn-helix transcriptional regulator [Flavobacterium]